MTRSESRPILAAVFVVITFITAAEAQTVWYVDAANCPGPGNGSQANPFCKIQDAINAAAANATPPDEIVVADGIYTGTGNKNLDFNGKTIRLHSANGAANCIIDCENSGRGFYFHHAETADAVVDGFTVRNGNVGTSSPGGATGGGIHCLSSRPTISNCIISGNTVSSGNGGGVYCSSSNATLINCTISGNTGYRGGGAYLSSGSPTLTHCTIADNTAGNTGGGIFCASTRATLTNCSITGNTGSQVGGVYFTGSSANATLTGCTISGNTTQYGTGAVWCDSSSSPILTACVISGNTGTGLYSSSSATPRLTNCTISGNRGGSGISCESSSSPALTNCTVSGNTGDSYSGGVYCSSASLTLTNCILWGDAFREIYLASGTVTATYCDVQGGYAGTGNINSDPRFAFSDNLHLVRGSPCIDTGTNSPPGGLPPTDVDGTPRPLDGNGDSSAVADMGAYEYDPAVPVMALSPFTIEALAFVGGPNPQPQTLSISNGGGGTLSWHVASQCSWVTVNPADGTCQQETDSVAVSFNSAGFTRGDYHCSLIATAVPGTRSYELPVTLHVRSILHVPSDYASILEAIEAAVSYDWIIVADGVYTGGGNKDLDFRGKLLRLQSENGPANCIIDCQGSGRAFYFHSKETAQASIEGLTIRNGTATAGSPYGARGGGIYCYDSGPTLTNCIISGNTAGYGGGIYFYQASSTLTNCTISGSSATSSSGTPVGGGIYCESSGLTLIDCDISGNVVASSSYSVDGGGIYCTGSGTSPTLTGCTISGNSASSSGAYKSAYGGGIYCSYSACPVLRNCVISENTVHSAASFAYGGGMYCYSSDVKPTLVSCTISNNTASSSAVSSYASGGGICCAYSSPALSNCVLRGNMAGGTYSGCGGGMCLLASSSPVLTNCTIMENIARGSSSGYGGGMYCDGAYPTLTNCILWGDAPQEIYLASGTTTVTYCDVQGGYTGTGNINANPLFAFSDDLRLRRGSPCVDKGTNSPSGGLPPTDADGTPRPLDGNGDSQAVADMGAYEFDPAAPALALSLPTIEVFAYLGGPNPDPQILSISNGGGGTLTWQIVSESPWVSVNPSSGSCQQDVDAVSVSFNAAGFAVGDYTALLTITTDPGSSHPHDIPVILHVRTALQVPSGYSTIQAAIDAAAPYDWVIVANGVYTGTGNKDLDFHGKAVRLRSVGGNPAACIIDCQQGGRGLYFHSGETSQALVEGFTIRNGNVAEYSPGGPNGGGACLTFSSPTLRNCVIEYNAVPGGLVGGPSPGLGGGLYFYASSSTLIDCVVKNNLGHTPMSVGGGICCDHNCNLTLTGCTIKANTIPTEGGGIDCYNSTLALTDCVISGNSVTASDLTGGGGLTLFSSQAALRNCLISGNTVTADSMSYPPHGSGVYCSSSSATFAGCTISRNALCLDGGSPYSGGAVYCESSSPVLINCILWGDKMGEIYRGPSGNPAVSYCDVQGGYTGTGNINADPLFIDATNGNFRLAAGSPCIDMGSNAAVPADVTTDLDGNPRILFSHPLHVSLPRPGQPVPPPPVPVVDMGAYEFRIAPLPEPEDVPVDPPVIGSGPMPTPSEKPIATPVPKTSAKPTAEAGESLSATPTGRPIATRDRWQLRASSRSARAAASRP